IQFFGRNPEQISNFVGQRSKIPDMGYRYYKVDMPHTVTSYFLFGYLYTTSVTNDSLIPDSFVLPASTFIIFYRSKNSLTSESISLRLMCTVIYSFRFKHLSTRFCQNRLGRSQTYRNFTKFLLSCIIMISRHNSVLKSFIFLPFFTSGW